MFLKWFPPTLVDSPIPGLETHLSDVFVVWPVDPLLVLPLAHAAPPRIPLASRQGPF